MTADLYQEEKDLGDSEAQLSGGGLTTHEGPVQMPPSTGLCFGCEPHILPLRADQGRMEGKEQLLLCG